MLLRPDEKVDRKRVKGLPLVLMLLGTGLIMHDPRIQNYKFKIA